MQTRISVKTKTTFMTIGLSFRRIGLRTQKLIETQSGIQETLSAEYEVNNWKELLPELNAFDAFINMVGVLFTIIVILGLGFSLMNIMNMS